jgi:hypothetical protein
VIPPLFTGETGVVIATGPSLTKTQIDYVCKAHHQGLCRVFGINRTFIDVPCLDVFHAYNIEFWNYYGEQIQKINAHRWTVHTEIANKYGAFCIQLRDHEGFSKTPNYINKGHSSGFQILNIAYWYGCSRLLLLGYDMQYPKDYDGRARQAGTQRHYFGEYPKELQHFPSSGMDENKKLIGLIDLYKKIEVDIEIINCTPNSALDIWPMKPLNKCL